jgi:hypothetical protein
MIFRIVKQTKEIIVISKQPILHDKRLSLKAKGLLTYLVGHPDRWELNLHDILKHCSDGKSSIMAGIRELKKYGYAQSENLRDQQGQFAGVSWVIREVSPETDFPLTEKPLTEKPENGFSDTNNNKRSNTYIHSNNDRNNTCTKEKKISSEINAENVCDVHVEKRLFKELPPDEQLHHVTRTLDEDRYAPLTEIYDAICLIQESEFPIKTSIYAFLASNKDERIFSIHEGKCVFSPNFEEEEQLNLYQKTPFDGFLPNPITEDEFKALSERIKVNKKEKEHENHKRKKSIKSIFRT